MYRHIRRMAMARPNRRLNLLDVASGSGDLPVELGTSCRKEGWTLQVTMTDNRTLAIEEQQRRARRYDLDVLSLQHDCIQSPLPGGFDVVTSSLFMHHLDDHQVFCLLQSMQSASEGAMVHLRFGTLTCELAPGQNRRVHLVAVAGRASRCGSKRASRVHSGRVQASGRRGLVPAHSRLPRVPLPIPCLPGGGNGLGIGPRIRLMGHFELLVGVV